MTVQTFTWATGVSGDWAIAGDWNPGTIPATATMAALIQAAPVGASYAVTIAGAESFTAAGVTLNNAGATLVVSGGLTLSPANGGALNATLGQITLTGGTIPTPRR